MRERQLAFRRHTVLRLSPDVLLVFKPAGHREEAHSHPYAQKLRVLSGKLTVARRTVRVLDRNSPPLTIRPGQRHCTEALQDTWMLAERPTGKAR